MFTSLLASLALMYSINTAMPNEIFKNQYSKPNTTLEEKVFDLSVSNSSESEIIPQQVYLVSQIIGQDEIADQTPKYAKVGQEVRLYVVLEAKVGKDTIFYTTAPKIKLDDKKIKPGQTKLWPENIPQPTIEIFKVQPTTESTSYPNNKKHIEYTEVPMNKGWEAKSDVHYVLTPDQLNLPKEDQSGYKDQFPDIESGLGVMHYKVTLKFNNKELNSPGKESIQYGGISDKVIRVSYRPDTGSWTDHLFEMFNTPYIWGSVTKQIDKQIGSDCADLVLYGWRRTGHDNLEYTWSEGLKNKKYSQLVIKVDWTNENRKIKDEHGNAITFDTVKEGDIVHFPGHVAVLYKDNGNNVLDCNDLIIHTLCAPPKIQGMCDAFGIPVEIRRWKGLE